MREIELLVGGAQGGRDDRALLLEVLQTGYAQGVTIGEMHEVIKVMDALESAQAGMDGTLRVILEDAEYSRLKHRFETCQFQNVKRDFVDVHRRISDAKIIKAK